MAGLIRIHRTWEEWVGFLLGTFIGLSPWLAGQEDSQIVMWNAVIVGAIVMSLAALELTSLQRWEEGAAMLCGLWLIASPFAFGYAGTGTLASWHFALGAMTVLLALFELWQDWHRSDLELSRYGHDA